MGEVASLTGRVARRPSDPAELAPATLAAVIQQLRVAARPKEYLRWIKASRGNEIDLIRVGQVCYFRADAKYTTVVTDRREAIIRRSIKQLASELDPDRFWQIHRSTIVNVEAIETVIRAASEFSVKLRAHPARLRVSEPFRNLFRPM
jgi:DNA-binding LytR/AlgR family response regulator